MENTDFRVYCGTYAKYTNGSIFGKWINLRDHNDIDELYEAFKKLHSDEADPEFMFQDIETPEEFKHLDLISESFINDNIYDYIKLYDEIKDSDTNDWVQMHNEYCQENKYFEDEIYYFDDEFFNMFFSDNPMEAARASVFGNINWGHDYIYFNGYANLETTEDPERDLIDKGAIIDWKINNM